MIAKRYEMNNAQALSQLALRLAAEKLHVFGLATKVLLDLLQGRTPAATIEERIERYGVSKHMATHYAAKYDQAAAIAEKIFSSLDAEENFSAPPDEPQSPASIDPAPDQHEAGPRPVYARVGVSMFSTSTIEKENTPQTFLPRKVYERVRRVFAALKTRCAADGVELHQPDSPVFGRLWLQVRGEMYAAARAAGVELEAIIDRLAPVVAALERAGGGLLAFVHSWRRGDYAGLLPAPRASGTGRRADSASAPQIIAAAHDPRLTQAVLTTLPSTTTREDARGMLAGLAAIAKAAPRRLAN